MDNLSQHFQSLLAPYVTACINSKFCDILINPRFSFLLDCFSFQDLNNKISQTQCSNSKYKFKKYGKKKEREREGKHSIMVCIKKFGNKVKSIKICTRCLLLFTICVIYHCCHGNQSYYNHITQPQSPILSLQVLSVAVDLNFTLLFTIMATTIVVTILPTFYPNITRSRALPSAFSTLSIYCCCQYQTLSLFSITNNCNDTKKKITPLFITVEVSCCDWYYLHLKQINFLIQIKYYKSNNVYTAISFII